MNFETQIIPVTPRDNRIDISDMPTVAETFLPYATAQYDALNANDNQTSFGKAWKAYNQDTGLWLEM